MAMLQVIQAFCKRTNLPVPTTVAGSTDPQITQLQALLEEEGNDLASRGSWEGITFEANLTTLALEDQGAMTTIAPNGYRYMINDTIWDRTTILPVCGPMSPKNWQAMKALFSTGPRFRYRMRGGHLLVNPVPPASDQWYFEYVSQNWILGANGSTYKQYFTLDTDTILLPETLVLMGLRWRWKKEKGLDYAEDMRTYEFQVKDALGRDGSKTTIQMDNSPQIGPRPGIFVSPGNWPLP